MSEARVQTRVRQHHLAFGWWRAPLVAGLAVLALASTPLLFARYYFGLDTTHIDLGLSCQLQALLQQRQPLWLSPWIGNGGILWTVPGSQLLYPLRWLVLPLPVDLGVSLFVVLHLALAAVGTAALVRSFHARPLIAACAGIFFAASGTAVDLIQHSYYLPPVAWLPWTWAACRRSFAQGSWRGTPSLVGVGVAMCLLGGEPQGAAIAFGLVLVETGWRVWRAGAARRQVLQRAALALGAAVAGSCAGLAPWPGFLVEAQLGSRGSPLASVEALAWSFDPPQWAATILPGRLFSSLAWQALLTGDDANIMTWNPSPYLGATFVVLLVLGSGRRAARMPALLLLLALVFALGHHTPFYPWLVRALPPLALFRYPQKYLLLMTLAAVVVAATQLGLLDRARPQRRLFVWAAAPMLLGLALVWGILQLHPAALAALWQPYAQDASGFAHLDAVALLSGALQHSLLWLLVAALAAGILRRPSRVIALLLVLDVVAAAGSSVKLGPSLADLHSPLHGLASGGPRVLCAHPGYLGVAFPTADVADAPWAHEAMLRLAAMPERQACDGMVSAVPYSPAISRVAKAFHQDRSSLGPGSARALGCSYLLHVDENLTDGVERETFDALPSENARRFARGGPPLYRIVDPIPEHFVARQPSLAADEEAVKQRMAVASTAALALSIVDDPLHRVAAGTALPDGVGVSIARVHWPVRSEVELELAGRGGAIVGVRTAFLVGWEAEQAGQARPVLRVSGNHVGVLVEDAARGPVTLRYRSPYLVPSVAVAAVGALALLGLPWLPRAHTRRTPVVSAGSGSAAPRGPAS